MKNRSCRQCRARLILVSLVLGAGIGYEMLENTRLSLLNARHAEDLQALREVLHDKRAQIAMQSYELTQTRGQYSEMVKALLDVRFSVPVAPSAPEITVPAIPERIRAMAGYSRPPPAQPRTQKASPAPQKAKSSSDTVTKGRTVFAALGVKKGKLYYRAYDGEIHVAAPGESLHGVQGSYRGYDAKRKTAILMMAGKVVEISPDASGKKI